MEGAEIRGNFQLARSFLHIFIALTQIYFAARSRRKNAGQRKDDVREREAFSIMTAARSVILFWHLLCVLSERVRICYRLSW